MNSGVWQRALAVWRALGVADPFDLARGNTLVLTRDWLDEGLLTNLLAVQRGLDASSAAAVVRAAAGYVAGRSCQRVTGRLLFLQAAAAPRRVLVADKEAWRSERGLPPNKASPGEPPLIGLRDVAISSDKDFAAAVGASQADVAAFTARAALAAHPPYQQLSTDAAELRERLARDPEVARLAGAAPAPGTAGKRQRGRDR